MARILIFWLCLLLSASAAGARVLHAVAFDGTVHAIEPSRVILHADSHTVQVPPALSTFTSDGRAVQYGNLQPGQRVHVTLQPVDATLSSIDEGLLTLETRRGSIVLPASLFPQADLDAMPAYLQLADHRFRAVKLSTALAMEARGEGFAMASLPVGAVFEPTTEAPPSHPMLEGPTINLPQMAFKATVRRLQRTSAGLEAADHLQLEVPSALASYDLDGVGVRFESLVPGDRVHVLVRAFSGVPVQLEPLVLSLQTASGTVRIPIKALPLSYRLHTLVPIRQSDGHVVDQPLPH